MPEGLAKKKSFYSEYASVSTTLAVILSTKIFNAPRTREGNGFDFARGPPTLARARKPTDMIAEDDIKNALKGVKYPGYSRDIVSFGLVKEIAAGKGAVSVSMSLTGGNAEVARQIKTESEQALRALP